MFSFVRLFDNVRCLYPSLMVNISMIREHFLNRTLLYGTGAFLHPLVSTDSLTPFIFSTTLKKYKLGSLSRDPNISEIKTDVYTY